LLKFLRYFPLREFQLQGNASDYLCPLNYVTWAGSYWSRMWEVPQYWNSSTSWYNEQYYYKHFNTWNIIVIISVCSNTQPNKFLSLHTFGTAAKWRAFLMSNLQALRQDLPSLSVICRQFSLQRDGHLNCTEQRCLLMVHILIPSVSCIRFVFLVLLLASNTAWIILVCASWVPVCASWVPVEGWPPRPFSTTTLNCTAGFSCRQLTTRPYNTECNTIIVQ
jgi:hypothetical protein